ncbi:hypothetical protein S547_003583 [Salmonella enterica subsp. enterica serovar Minnesota]|nr:hypothetical protein [Salmonella enterica subsp. enterica serovar Minnesota]
MSTITREQLIEKLQNRIAVTANYPGVEEAQLDAAIFKIALASLEAKPIGAFHIADQQVDGTTDYIKDGEWPIDNGVIEVYAAPPAPVVPDGYALVPVEPTDEMIAAAMNCEDVLFNSDESFCVQFGNIYEAMLAAAPQQEVK